MNEDTTENVVSHRVQEVFACTSEHLDAEVVCEVFAGVRERLKKGIQIKAVSRIRIVPKEPKGVDWFAALAFRLENFFSLMLGTSVEIEHVQLFQGGEEGWLIQKVNARKEKVDLQARVRCKFEDTATALERWLGVPEDDQLVELTLLGVLRKSDLFGAQEFLALAQALEGFGRIRFGGTKRRMVKFDNLIRETHDLFTAETAQQLVGERKAFAEKVIQTRDYYTHLGNPKGTSAAKSEKELFLLNKRMHAFLRGAILVGLGIPEEAFRQAIVYHATRWK